MNNPLRVGVVGLGRRWQRRYLPALQALRGRFAVRAVCDQIAQRALGEAQRLGCRAAGGPTALLESPDIDALLLLDPQWHGLWPLEAAARLGKPAFCRGTLEDDEAHADGLLALEREGRLRVQFAPPARLAPAVAWWRERLETRLGAARVVLCDLVRPRPRADLSGLAELFDLCNLLLAGKPTGVLAGGGADGRLVSVLVEQADGRVARVTRVAARGRAALRVTIVAERGTVRLRLPSHLGWDDEEGRHALALPNRVSAARRALERFHEAVTKGQALGPGVEEAHRALALLRAARRSRAEGGRVALDEPATGGGSGPSAAG